MKLHAGGKCRIAKMSLPVRERGLKLNGDRGFQSDIQVAPRAGAWIETLDEATAPADDLRRSPCGSVD